jgi:hypothetical protein
VSAILSLIILNILAESIFNKCYIWTKFARNQPAYCPWDSTDCLQMDFLNTFLPYSGACRIQCLWGTHHGAGCGGWSCQWFKVGGMWPGWQGHLRALQPTAKQQWKLWSQVLAYAYLITAALLKPQKDSVSAKAASRAPHGLLTDIHLGPGFQELKQKL